jgi:hypothetical protein
MMRQVDNQIRRHSVSFKEVRADRRTFGKIVADMRQYGGELVPASVWVTLDTGAPCGKASKEVLDSSYSSSVFERKMSTMNKMLGLWIGRLGLSPLNEEEVERYRELIADSDPLGLWKTNVQNEVVASSLIVADLGSIMDMDLIYGLRFAKKPVTRILEVGGGYGRLAEAMLNVFGSSIRYVLVDSVPASLYYAREYLVRACPEMHIGSFYTDDLFDLDRYECYVIPSWHFESLNEYSYDICININSFEEMLQEHVDFYLQLFDKVTADQALIYISNAHDYYFRGSWNYPKHWRQLLCSNNPRGSTRHSPTEVFIKSAGDYSLQNTILRRLYAYSVDHPAPEDSLECLLTILWRRMMMIGVSELFIHLAKYIAGRGRGQLLKFRSRFLQLLQHG